MATRHEIPLDVWTPVRDELLQLLRDVAHRQSTIMPGQGFFKLATELGRNADDPMKLWSDELKLVYRVNAATR